MGIAVHGLREFTLQHKKSKLYCALVLAFSAMGSNQALAVPNYWWGPAEVTANQAWSEGVVDSGGANVINSSTPAAPWFPTNDNSNLYVPHGLYVGHASSGTFNIIFDDSEVSAYLDVGYGSDPSMPPLMDNDPLFRIGDAGGDGTLLIDLRSPVTTPMPRLQTGSASLGVGLGAASQGLVDILGAGKQVEELGYNSPNAVVFDYPQGSSLIGQQGGTGRVNIDGAGLVFLTGVNNTPGTAEPLSYFAVGEGAGSQGLVNILGNGKLASGSPFTDNTAQKGDLLPFNFVGKDGGDGVITVEATASGFPNQADFYAGLSVGSNGGNGSLTILEGGKSLITNGSTMPGGPGICQATNPDLYPLAPASLQISGDGSSAGLVRATGSGTQLLVAGKTSSDYYSEEPTLIQEHAIGKVHINSGASLVTAANASVKIGVATWQFHQSGDVQYFTSIAVGGLGPINVTGSGRVVYGSETPAPEAPGGIEASQITLGASSSQLVFNHTGNLNFNLPLMGNGQLVQQAGTTVVSATLAGLPDLDPSQWLLDDTATCAPAVADYPSNQADFTGSLNVQGGTLVLPATDVLPAITATHISGGTLAQGGTNQNLGAVTQSGGVLQLTGGSATDTATASNWAGGGGVVQLDTVLGADGSDSDQLQITGAISGTTLLNISNVGGTGAQTTGNGILVVQTDSPNAADSFVLANGPLVAGGFQYQLRQVDNNWYLASSPYVGPPIATVKPVPSLSWLSLLGLSGLLAALASRITRRRSL